MLMSLLFKIPIFGLQRANANLPQDVSPILEAEAIPTFRQALPRLSGELERARRYRRPLSIVLLSHSGSGTAEGAGHPAAGRQPGHRATSAVELSGPVAAPDWLVSVRLAFILRKALRESDIVMYAATQGCCMVGMPEVDAGEARQAVGRLNELCFGRPLLPLRAGIAVFPQDGWTLEELIRHAEEDWQRTPVAGPRPVLRRAE